MKVVGHGPAGTAHRRTERKEGFGNPLLLFPGAGCLSRLCFRVLAVSVAAMAESETGPATFLDPGEEDQRSAAKWSAPDAKTEAVEAWCPVDHDKTLSHFCPVQKSKNFVFRGSLDFSHTPGLDTGACLGFPGRLRVFLAPEIPGTMSKAKGTPLKYQDGPSSCVGTRSGGEVRIRRSPPSGCLRLIVHSETGQIWALQFPLVPGVYPCETPYVASLSGDVTQPPGRMLAKGPPDVASGTTRVHVPRAGALRSTVRD